MIVLVFVGVVVNNFKNVIFVRVFDMVDIVKIFEILDKLWVLFGMGGEGVMCLVFIFNDFFVNLCMVISIYMLYVNSFFLFVFILWLIIIFNSIVMLLCFRVLMVVSSCVLLLYLVGMLFFWLNLFKLNKL